jgi:hypothetical protein
MAGNQIVLVAARDVSADRKPASAGVCNRQFLLTGPPESTGGCQGALVDKLGVSPSRSRLLTGPHRYHLGLVQQAQGRSVETTVSPHHNNNLPKLQCDIQLHYIDFWRITHDLSNVNTWHFGTFWVATQKSDGISSEKRDIIIRALLQTECQWMILIFDKIYLVK